jgi:hypothetical protein
VATRCAHIVDSGHPPTPQWIQEPHLLPPQQRRLRRRYFAFAGGLLRAIERPKPPPPRRRRRPPPRQEPVPRGRNRPPAQSHGPVDPPSPEGIDLRSRPRPRAGHRGESSHRFFGQGGLANLGNTCFINASLQCLSNTVPLTDYFLGYEYRSEINPDNFLGARVELRRADQAPVAPTAPVTSPRGSSPTWVSGVLRFVYFVVDFLRGEVYGLCSKE